MTTSRKRTSSGFSSLQKEEEKVSIIPLEDVSSPKEVEPESSTKTLPEVIQLTGKEREEITPSETFGPRFTVEVESPQETPILLSAPKHPRNTPKFSRTLCK